MPWGKGITSLSVISTRSVQNLPFKIPINKCRGIYNSSAGSRLKSQSWSCSDGTSVMTAGLGWQICPLIWSCTDIPPHPFHHFTEGEMAEKGGEWKRQQVTGACYEPVMCTGPAVFILWLEQLCLAAFKEGLWIDNSAGPERKPPPTPPAPPTHLGGADVDNYTTHSGDNSVRE